MSATHTQCIGGPLDGKFATDCGSVLFAAYPIESPRPGPPQEYEKRVAYRKLLFVRGFNARYFYAFQDLTDADVERLIGERGLL